jgi:hypothetical protein
MNRCNAALDDLGDERQVMAWFLANRARPLVQFWLELFVTVEAGAALKIRIPEDIPPWFDGAEAIC